MDFTFVSSDVERMEKEMRQEGSLIAIKQEVAANSRFNGMFVASIGQINQQEWDKWRLA